MSKAIEPQLAAETASHSRARLTRVSAATIIGSAIEAFDFLAYGTASALVFNKLFFPATDPTVATLAAFGAFASGLLARPIGGIIFGHYGDRIGRKSMLTLSLLLMGLCTVLIGLLPTYQSIGLWAAVLLVLLRIGQGLSFGGELGGAMLMAVEHAPPKWKSFFGSLPQAGTPVGLLLSAGAFALVSQLPESAFMSWGWRLPFLASAVLIAVGVFIRMKVEESPEFASVKDHRRTAAYPAKDLVLQHRRPLLLTMGAKLSEVTLYHTIAVFSISYATGKLGFTRGEALNALMLAAACQIITIPFFGWLADKVGARRLYVAGGIFLACAAVPLFQGLASGSLTSYTIAVVVSLSICYAVMFGPQSNLFGAQFPAELRYSGLSIGIQFAAAIGGGFAPLISTLIVQQYGSILPVGFYIAALAVISTVSAYFMQPTSSEAGRRHT